MEIQPIGDAQRRQVLARTEQCLSQGEALFGRTFARIPVLFDLSGTTAGMFRRRGRHREIRYNPWIFARYFEQSLRNTVPHEVAHYLVCAVYGDRRVRPHGEQWRAVMAQLGAAPEVTFRLCLEGVPQRRQRRHRYRCACREHSLSSTRHNRVQRGSARYECASCRTPLCYLSDQL